MIHNAYMLERFICVFGIRPDTALIDKTFKELIIFNARAAYARLIFNELLAWKLQIYLQIVCFSLQKFHFREEKFSRGWGGRIETSLCPLVRPAGVGSLEVRFAHPVRLAPDTHSQGHGRPCLQRLHPRRAFPKNLFLLYTCYIFVI